MKRFKCTVEAVTIEADDAEEATRAFIEMLHEATWDVSEAIEDGVVVTEEVLP